MLQDPPRSWTFLLPLWPVCVAMPALALLVFPGTPEGGHHCDLFTFSVLGRLQWVPGPNK